MKVAKGTPARVPAAGAKAADAEEEPARQELSEGADPAEYTVIVAVREGRQGREFLMVRHRERGWELPGGKLEPNEGPVHCALREFREETGHLLGGPRFVKKMAKPNGTCYIFTGTLGAPAQGRSQTESIETHEWFSALPPRSELAFPDDPYDEIGSLLGIQFA